MTPAERLARKFAETALGLAPTFGMDGDPKTWDAAPADGKAFLVAVFEALIAAGGLDIAR